MSMDNYSGNPVAQRKAEVRKHSRTLQISGGVVVAGILLGLFTTKFFFVVALVALVVGIVSGVKINQIVNHKDTW
ncbi:hypothetical protein [Corynebacterium terpenotabidum]|uniref:Uncharacterized protein n=1 Tax=Corynebacterium terpenotabidum Y-11 TaxID=1200352 RepID=S4XG26_9CORY|nr:hypothetical protein [Corynebacterium terpenotabidum]AGP30610.1 hypothetical protein A606_04805 [Corynebacterium terpenotabidum Y-11]